MFEYNLDAYYDVFSHWHTKLHDHGNIGRHFILLIFRS